MTTDRQRAANRRNARRSTGPRTAAGKRASSGNARRHGLTAALDMDVLLPWYRTILEDATAVPDPLGQDPYLRAAAELARAEAHLQRVRATEEMWLIEPTVLSKDEADLRELREHVVEALVVGGANLEVLSIPGSERALFPPKLPPKDTGAFYEALEKYARHPAAKVGWDRKGFGRLRRLDREIAHIGVQTRAEREKMAATFSRYRALAEARRLRALARWTDQVALQRSRLEGST